MRGEIVLLVILLSYVMGNYSERLDIYSQSNAINYDFHFNVSSAPLQRGRCHTTYIHQKLCYLFHYDIDEFKISLSQGRFNSKIWKPFPHAPRGSHLHLYHNLTMDPSELLEGLNGLLGTNLVAKLSHQPVLLDEQKGNMYHHMINPRDTFCTENDIAFLSLLPCRGALGLGSLFTNPQHFYADYRALSLSSRKECLEADCATFQIHLQLHYLLGFHAFNQSSFTLSQGFEHGIGPACPLAERSDIVIHGGAVGRIVNTDIPLTSEVPIDVKGVDGEMDIIVEEDPSPLAVAPFQFYRKLYRQGKVDGQLVTTFKNDYPHSTSLTYHAVMPWYVKPSFHDMEVRVDGERLDRPLDILQNMTFLPCEDHGHPTLIEFTLTVPSHSEVSLTLHYQLMLMIWIEFPPDHHRGFDIGTATVQVHPQGAPTFILYDDNALSVELPTPDFSMPYNVITFTGFTVSIIFGFVFTMLVHDLEDYVIDGKVRGDGFLGTSYNLFLTKKAGWLPVVICSFLLFRAVVRYYKPK